MFEVQLNVDRLAHQRPTAEAAVNRGGVSCLLQRDVENLRRTWSRRRNGWCAARSALLRSSLVQGGISVTFSWLHGAITHGPGRDCLAGTCLQGAKGSAVSNLHGCQAPGGV